VIRASWGRARSLTEEVVPTARPPQTSRDRPPVRGIPGPSRGDGDAHGRPMMPRLAEDSATGTGRVATRRLDADDRVRISTVRSILRATPTTG
jgi:hypothetical protein